MSLCAGRVSETPAVAVRRAVSSLAAVALAGAAVLVVEVSEVAVLAAAASVAVEQVAVSERNIRLKNHNTNSL